MIIRSLGELGSKALLKIKGLTPHPQSVVPDLSGLVTQFNTFHGVLKWLLVALSVTIWYYLQFISAYLSVPMSAVIFTGLMWKRGNTKGAIGGVVWGFQWGWSSFLTKSGLEVAGAIRPSVALFHALYTGGVDHCCRGDDCRQLSQSARGPQQSDA